MTSFRNSFHFHGTAFLCVWNHFLKSFEPFLEHQQLAFCGLSENGPHCHLYLNIWSPVGETVWKEFRGVSLLEDVHHWRQALRFVKPVPTPVCFLCLAVVSQDVCNAALVPGWLPACCCAPSMMVMDSYPLKLSPKLNAF